MERFYGAFCVSFRQTGQSYEIFISTSAEDQGVGGGTVRTDSIPSPVLQLVPLCQHKLTTVSCGYQEVPRLLGMGSQSKVVMVPAA